MARGPLHYITLYTYSLFESGQRVGPSVCAWENARKKIEIAVAARAKHEEMKAAQGAGRRRMREDLEAREDAAKRSRGPSEDELRAARMKEEEDDAMAELKRELDHGHV